MDPTTVCQQAHGYEPENFDMNKLKQLKNDYSQAKNAIQKRTALRKFLETLPRQAKKQDAPTEYSTITQNNTPNAIYQNTEHANSPRLIEEPAITSILEIDADKPRNEVTDFLVHSGNLFRRFFRNLGRKLPGDYKKGERVLLKNFLDELAKTTEKIPNPSLSYLNPDEAESPLFAFMRDITFL
jgi:hypothetical protein